MGDYEDHKYEEGLNDLMAEYDALDKAKEAQEEYVESLVIEKIREFLRQENIEFYFKKHGQIWTIVYEGHLFRLDHNKGLTYILELLKHPHDKINVNQLMQLETVGSVALDKMTNEGMQAQELSISDGSLGTHIDEQAITEYRQRVRSIDAELEMAQKNSDLGRKEELINEREKILDEIKRNVTPSGNLKTNNPQLKKTVDAVRKCIKETIKYKIITHDKKLADHLSDSLNYGNSLSYTPKIQIPWKF